MASPPTIGRNTNGGLEMMSKPLSVAPTGVGLGVVVAVAPGEGDGEGDSVGEGEGEGDVAGASIVKFAHGFGCTLAQSLCTPDASPENGFTCVTKFPLPSATAPPATLFD
jgi:hypothetical protein